MNTNLSCWYQITWLTLIPSILAFSKYRLMCLMFPRCKDLLFLSAHLSAMSFTTARNYCFVEFLKGSLAIVLRNSALMIPQRLSEHNNHFDCKRTYRLRWIHTNKVLWSILQMISLTLVKEIYVICANLAVKPVYACFEALDMHSKVLIHIRSCCWYCSLSNTS